MSKKKTIINQSEPQRQLPGPKPEYGEVANRYSLRLTEYTWLYLKQHTKGDLRRVFETIARDFKLSDKFIKLCEKALDKANE